MPFHHAPAGGARQLRGAGRARPLRPPHQRQHPPAPKDAGRLHVHTGMRAITVSVKPNVTVSMKSCHITTDGQILCLLTFVVGNQLTLHCKISDNKDKSKGTAHLWYLYFITVNSVYAV